MVSPGLAMLMWRWMDSPGCTFHTRASATAASASQVMAAMASAARVLRFTGSSLAVAVGDAGDATPARRRPEATRLGCLSECGRGHARTPQARPALAAAPRSAGERARASHPAGDGDAGVLRVGDHGRAPAVH